MGLDLLVEFEFRTTRTIGVLLGISSQKMDGMGIEMIDEKVSVSHLSIFDLFMILVFICRNSVLKLCCILCWEKARLYLFILLDDPSLFVFSAHLFCRPV